MNRENFAPIPKKDIGLLIYESEALLIKIKRASKSLEKDIKKTDARKMAGSN